MKKNYVLLFLLIGCSKIIAAQTGNIIIPSGTAFSANIIQPDKQGKYLYVVEGEQTVMWDIKTHQQLYTFPAGTGQFCNFGISNDGTKIRVNGSCFSTITGKFLFSSNYAKCFHFSADDKKIYTYSSDGINVIDALTGNELNLAVVKDFDTYNSNISVIDNNHIVISNLNGWQIWNTSQKTMDFEYKSTQVAPFIYLEQMNCMAVDIYKEGSMQGINIYDVHNGKLLKSLPGKGSLVPSEDSKEFIWLNDKCTFYNADNFSVTKQTKLDPVMYYQFFSGNTNTIYGSYGAPANNLVVLNIKTNAKDYGFKRQIAFLGLGSSMEYNYTTGILNIMTDDSVYKSINLVKLLSLRHQPVYGHLSTTTFSPTGDTIADFFYKSCYIKNIKTGKILLSSIPLKYKDEFSSPEKDNYFFSKNGEYVYYTMYSGDDEKNYLNRINIKTHIIEKVINFKGTESSYLHPDKEILAAIEKGYKYTHAKVWNIVTGKLLFDKEIMEGETCDFISVSFDKTKILLVHNNTSEIYNLADGSLITKSPVFEKLRDFGGYSCTPDLSLLIKHEYNGELTAINAKGNVVYTKKTNFYIRRALFSPDNALMFTVCGDQTIKVWQPLTGKLLGTIYLFNDGTDFVFIDLYGHFDGTSGGIKRLYYYKDRHVIPLDFVYEKFYTPNLYQRLINGEEFDPANVIINNPPLIKMSYAQATRNLSVEEDSAPIYENTTGQAEITINASADNDKVDEIRLFHNGKIVNLATRGLFVTDNNSSTETKKYSITLLPGQNSFRAVALNSQRTESVPDDILVNFKTGNQAVNNAPKAVIKGVPVDVVDKTATLYLVVIGINKYQNEKLSLNYALADATAFKDEIEKDAKTVLGNVKTFFVTDNTADKKGITDALAEVRKNAKPQDVFVFYYAGHGYISDKTKEFYLVPTDVADIKNVDEELLQKGIPSKMLQTYAIDIQAQKQIFILDACQSAGAFQALLTNDANQQKSLAVVSRSTGTHWMAASGSQQFAQEFATLKHGAFTYVLLQALQGQAAANKMITVNGLKTFMQLQVPELMKKYNSAPQYPASYGFGNDFPVEIIR